MREIKYTTRFQRDYKREKSGRHSKKLDIMLMEVVNLLAAGTRGTGVSIQLWPPARRRTASAASANSLMWAAGASVEPSTANKRGDR